MKLDPGGASPGNAALYRALADNILASIPLVRSPEIRLDLLLTAAEYGRLAAGTASIAANSRRVGMGSSAVAAAEVARTRL